MEERQDSFIVLLARCNGVIAQAMREDGAPVWRTLRRWRRDQPAFEERVQDCIHASMEKLHEVAVRLAQGDLDTPPSENMLRFVLSHCSDQYKKNDDPVKIELSVERTEQQTDDLRRLLTEQRTISADPPQPPDGGRVSAAAAIAGSRAVPSNSAGSHDDDS